MKHCVILHLYYQDLWPEFKEKLLPILSDNVHLYVSIIEETEFTSDIKKHATDVLLVENRGMDIAPFIKIYSKVKQLGYVTYLKLHSKKSLHTMGVGDYWRQSLYFTLVENYNTILEQVKNISGYWMAGSDEWYHDMGIEPKSHRNKIVIDSFLQKSLSKLNLIDEGSFFAGTMFLTNNIYLDRLFNNVDLDKLYNEFETGYSLCSFAHGMERAIGYGIHQFNGKYIKIANNYTVKNNISLLVGLKNNLDYNKHFYKTTRGLYPNVEICFVSYGSTDGTHEWLDTLDDKNVKYYYSKENKTFSDTFNKAAELATKEYVAYLHNDIVLAPNFIENLAKHVGQNNVVSYTTIEPPIFSGHERPGKLIHDLGTNLETFSTEKLYDFVKKNQLYYLHKTEPGITFFMCMPRVKLLEIGGLDNLFNPMFCEDDDLIRRWKLIGMNCFTVLDAICYHFVSKTSRFSEEFQAKTNNIEYVSNRNFIRKWGTRSSAPKYNIAIVLSNASLNTIELLEPWCDRLYISNTKIEISEYINQEQPKTKYDLTKRVLINDLNDAHSENDIVVELDAVKLDQKTYTQIQQLAEIIMQVEECGVYELDDLKINIRSLIPSEAPIKPIFSTQD